MTEEKKPEIDPEIDQQLTKKEREVLLNTPTLATLDILVTPRPAFIKNDTIFPHFEQSIWIASNVIIKKRFEIKEIDGKHSLSTSVIKDKFSELPEDRQNTFKRIASEQFKQASEEQQQALINQGFQHLTIMKDDLPENIQAALRKEMKKRGKKAREEVDDLIARRAAQMGISVERLQREVTLLYCMVNQEKMTEEKIKQGEEK